MRSSRLSEWGSRCPVVIVPTKYYATPTDVFRQHGFSMVIWANHMLRAAVATMQKTARALKQSENLLSIEDKVAPVSEIFRLQNAAELLEAEERYLPRGAEGTSAVVLAASRERNWGIDRGSAQNDGEGSGTPILSHIVDAYNAVGIKDILVVRGYKKEAVRLPNLTYVDNAQFADNGELASLSLALQSRKGHFQPTIVSYGDVLFNKYIPQALCQESDDCVIFVDSNWQDQTSYARLGGFAECTVQNSRKAFNAKVYLKQLGGAISQDSIHGVWMGFLKLSPNAAAMVDQLLLEILARRVIGKPAFRSCFRS